MNNDVIVLIDTGLDKEIYRNRIVGGIHFYIEDEMICCDKNYNDDNGHGTACADVITRVYKNARFCYKDFKFRSGNKLSAPRDGYGILHLPRI